MNKETIEYLKESNKNKFGYEQDKIISYDDAQEIVEHLETFENRKIELERENKQLKDKAFSKSTIINKVKQFCENKMVKMKKNRNSIAVFLLIDILKIIEKEGK